MDFGGNQSAVGKRKKKKAALKTVGKPEEKTEEGLYEGKERTAKAVIN